MLFKILNALILEWLNERRKIPQEWAKRLKATKLKCSQLIDDVDGLQEDKIKDYII